MARKTSSFFVSCGPVSAKCGTFGLLEAVPMLFKSSESTYYYVGVSLCKVLFCCGTGSPGKLIFVFCNSGV